MTSRMLSMRDQAFADLGDTDLTDGGVDGASPQFTINPNDGDPSNGPTASSTSPTRPPPTTTAPRTSARSTGTVKVPCYMTDPDGGGPAKPCDPGAVLNTRRERRPEAERLLRRPLHLQHPAIGGRRQRQRDRTGPDLDVRARPVRRLHRGPHPRRADARQRPRGDDLRDRLHRHVRGRRLPGRDPGAERPVEFQAAGRSAAAGLPRLPLPRPDDDPPGRVREQPRLPVQRRTGHRHDRSRCSTTATARAGSPAGR